MLTSRGSRDLLPSMYWNDEVDGDSISVKLTTGDIEPRWNDQPRTITFGNGFQSIANRLGATNTNNAALTMYHNSTPVGVIGVRSTVQTNWRKSNKYQDIQLYIQSLW